MKKNKIVADDFLKKINRYYFMFAAIWTVAISIILSVEILHDKRISTDFAKHEAETLFRKDISFRFWNAMHGGVYVEVDENTPPNPYLSNVKERDIETPSGKKLTLINPAYMIRQVYDNFSETYGIDGHITSIKPIRPENAPSAWERKALEEIDRTKTGNYFEIVGENEDEYLKAMFGLYVREECLKCHATQGYKVGDLRGGIGVRIPMKPFLIDAENHVWKISLGMSALWSLGIFGLLIARKRMIFDHEERKKMEANLIRTQKIESLGVLAGGIAHNFNNFLTGILGNIELAKLESDRESEVFGLLEEAGKAVVQATSLTKQLLTFSKGGAPMKKIISISDILKEASDFHLKGSKSVCRLKIADDIAAVYADEGQINQVMGNLILNADQAMPNGGTIEITAENIGPFVMGEDVSLPKDKNYVKITVKDNGVGIAKENLLQIFDPYFTTKEKGYGLGLSTVYSIVKRHDGAINVKSKPGEGSEFSIYLPASEEQIQTAPPDKSDMFRSVGKILLMDDEPMVSTITAKMLQKMDLEVTSVADGESAVEEYRKAKKTGAPYSLVILDLTIPGGMGGKETAEYILKIDPDAKIIAASGYSNDPVISNYSEYGFKDAISKPIGFEELSNKIKKILKR